MRRIIIPAVCLLCGIGVGWFFGYTRPTAKNQRKLLMQYHYVKDAFHMTDSDMADFGEHVQDYIAAMKRQDELAAAMAYGALVRLDRGDVDHTRHILDTAISVYYRGHSQDGDSNLLFHIQAFAATNASLSNAIYRRLE